MFTNLSGSTITFTTCFPFRGRERQLLELILRRAEGYLNPPAELVIHCSTTS